MATLVRLRLFLMVAALAGSAAVALAQTGPADGAMALPSTQFSAAETAQTSGIGGTGVPAYRPELATPVATLDGAAPLRPSASLTTPPIAGCAPNNSLYTRIDYFYWREDFEGSRLLKESGPLVSIGCSRQNENGRLWGEVFGGVVDYDGSVMDDPTDAIKSKTGYFGGRLEYDFLRPLGDAPGNNLFFGVGSRVWNRSLRSSVSQSGLPTDGYEEIWWTIYPLIGLEARCPLGASELYASTSFGYTAFNYERINEFHVTLYPKIGPLVRTEIGLQGQRLSLAATLEVARFYQSEYEGDDYYFQPDSLMLTCGLTGGLRF